MRNEEWEEALPPPPHDETQRCSRSDAWRRSRDNRNILLEKAEDFAVTIVLLCDVISNRNPLRIVTGQILRSASSIGANATEAQSAVSPADFYNKLMISLKEARETAYWLRLLYRTGRLMSDEYATTQSACDELIRILTAITKKLRAR